MNFSPQSTLGQLLNGWEDAILQHEAVPAVLLPDRIADFAGAPTRAVIAAALNLVLFAELLGRVPTGRDYVTDVLLAGGKIRFDHGALRTVDLEGMGQLPRGVAAIARVLEPLGYVETAIYPLERLKMTGRSFTHQDFPEDLPQFFVSELHVAQFSPAFAAAARRVTETSRDPLDAQAKASLARLKKRGSLPLLEAQDLVPKLVACFQCQHSIPALSDYETLRAESAEMAWIATEGNVFNHATDRVADLEQLAERQRKLGRPLKAAIEVSRNGRVRQTAYKADLADRPFLSAEGQLVLRSVPGSFYEFIQRARFRDAETGCERLDLSFDSSNAQGIFKMTAAA